MPVTKSFTARVIIQILVVSFLAVCGTYLVEMIGYKGYFNLLTALIVIAIVVYFLNEGYLAKIIMFVILCALSFAVVGVTGQVLGYAD
ncbi:MAG TPA: hypothetical protein VK403_06845 [Allosphingosinicella sp.]|nr:hypothetical protein [Allosphingosinicella sp.]